MIAKNKGDFLYQLHNELHRIGIDDDEEIFADFEEHFKESQEAGVSEEETCEKLGDVKDIARNYLDITSTKVNSIVVDAVANQRVSLTKPGEKLPADISLVKDEVPAQEPANEQENASASIREFTPEHIAQEPEAPAPSVPKVDLNKETVREVTPEHIAQEPEAPSPASASANSGDTRYQYRKGASPESNSWQDSHRAEMPNQPGASGATGATGAAGAAGTAGKSGFCFTDLKSMKPNVNAGKLVVCIVMDVFLWSWLIPMVVSLIFSVVIGGAFALVINGFGELGNEGFHIVSRILLCCGMVSGGVIVGCIAGGLIKAVVHWIKNIVISHIKAVYDL